MANMAPVPWQSPATLVGGVNAKPCMCAFCSDCAGSTAAFPHHLRRRRLDAKIKLTNAFSQESDNVQNMTLNVAPLTPCIKMTDNMMQPLVKWNTAPSTVKEQDRRQHGG